MERVYTDRSGYNPELASALAEANLHEIFEKKLNPRGSSVNGKSSAVSAGISGQDAGLLPDVPSSGNAYEAVASTETRRSYLGSLSKLFSKRDGSARDADLASAMMKLDEQVTDVNTQKLLGDHMMKRATLADKREKIEKQQEEMEKAKAASKRANKSGLFANVVGLAVNLAVCVAAVALVVSGAGAPLGAAMLASAALGVVGNVNGIMVASGKEGFLSDRQEKALFITSMVIGAATFVFGGAAMMLSHSGSLSKTAPVLARFLGPGNLSKAAGSAGSNAANTAGNVAATSTAKTAAEINNIQNKMYRFGHGLQAAAMTAEGAGNAQTQVFLMDAAEHKSDAEKQRADAKKIEANMQELDAIIEVLIAFISDVAERFSSMLGQFMDSINDRGSTLARVQFSG